MSSRNHFPTVAVIGGGVTGATVALHLARRLGQAETAHFAEMALGPHGSQGRAAVADVSAPPLARNSLRLRQREERKTARIVLFEPRDRLGAGLAYDTAEPVHRINVPAERMSLFPDDPESFARWLTVTGALKDDPEAVAGGVPFPRRETFGRYAAAQLQPFIDAGAVEHRRVRATRARKEDGGWRITDQDGETLDADILALAVSHPAPALPSSLRPLAAHPGLVADATLPDALGRIGPEDRVLVVGNGLTAADVIAALKRRGHTGRIVSVSRRGLRSRGHPATAQEPFGDFLHPPARHASELLGRIRRAIREAETRGLSWHAVLDAVRQQAQDIWASLPLSETRRLVRHVRPFWDVHRFRIAPQIEAVLDRAIADGSLTVKAASIRSAEADGDTIRVLLKERRRADPEPLEVEAVVVTTGPAHGGILGSQPLLSQLAADGYIALCPTGLGLWCNRDSQALSPDGTVEDGLLIAGPLARGTYGELMGLPQVTEHAVFIAEQIASRVGRDIPAQARMA
ncbi:FAD-dependent oxidoreductase [Rhizobiaceae bacterium BDR2-2]|uniref:FAD-dependent oxidoreductase n=1 Tax=Ectorhizobium quercum TaxID=2965071 RepID=A0AAE3SXK1_9HYPH|nr:FAD-dependent oxidoreductase [Ectorhizobium quercum]MCX8999863.1 FAD-dependent oxidoreductase [Ectorhizobium quercum]